MNTWGLGTYGSELTPYIRWGKRLRVEAFMLCEATRKENENARLGFAPAIGIARGCSLFNCMGLKFPQTKQMVCSKPQQTDSPRLNGTTPIDITMLPVA
jgi:hypothetical protein